MLLAVVAAMIVNTGQSAAIESAQAVLGPSALPLDGSWKFKTGDNPNWANAAFDDSGWESTDLTAQSGAHDGDVGLASYVPGWNARGLHGYSGYAWYRRAVAINPGVSSALAISGPAALDSAYQLFVDGQLLGGSGDFTGRQPVAVSVRPQLFPLTNLNGSSNQHLIAIRVWMDSAVGDADAGGMHVVPVIGTLAGVTAVNAAQWLQTIKGYVIDALEPIGFIILGIMVACLGVAQRGDRAYPSLCFALLLTALVRVNQIVFFWSPLETLRTYDLVRNVILTPWLLMAWIVAWRDWLRSPASQYSTIVLAGLAVLYCTSQIFSRAWLAPTDLHALKPALHVLSSGLRLGFATVFVWVLAQGLKRKPVNWTCGLELLAALLTATALFAEELSQLHVKGIWFPYGTGVSRTQYAYAALIVILFGLILGRFVRLARASREIAVVAAS